MIQEQLLILQEILCSHARELTSRLSSCHEPGGAPEEGHQEPRGLVGDLLVEVLEAEAHVESVLSRLVFGVAEERRLAGQQEVGDGSQRPDVRLRERRLVHQQLGRCKGTSGQGRVRSARGLSHYSLSHWALKSHIDVWIVLIIE